MQISKGRLGWGVFFIVLGGVPLAYHAGLIATSTITEAWKLWPLILVGLGIGFILERTPAAVVGGLVVASIFGAMLGSALSVGPNVNVGCSHGSNHVSASRDGTFDGSGRVTLKLQCGTATIGASADSSWHVSAGNDSGREPSISSGASWVNVTASEAGWPGSRGHEDWQVQVPADGTASLSSTVDFGDARLSFGGAKLDSATITLNMGSLHMDLTGATVGRLSLSTNLGATWLELDGSSNLTGSLSTSLGSLEVCAPSSLGLRIKSSESLGSSDMKELGLIRMGDYWQTPNYDTAEHRADLDASTSLGSLELHPAGGCK